MINEEKNMNIFERVKNILFRPGEEWRVIDKETITVGGLYTGYIIPLALIGPVCGVIGMSVFGMNIPLAGTIRLPFLSVLTHGILSFVLSLAGVYILALIVDGLAPAFSGKKNMDQALKVTAYSSTAAWVVGVFSLVPGLAILGLFGLYSFYLLYRGLPVLMQAPQEKGLTYTVVVIICAIVVVVVMAMISAMLLPMPAIDLPVPGAMPGK
jgi:hypothetical protein